MAEIPENTYGGGPDGSGNYGDVGDPCAAQNQAIAEARDLCRLQIQSWRAEKPARSWAWIYKQPAAKAYYGPLGGK